MRSARRTTQSSSRFRSRAPGAGRCSRILFANKPCLSPNTCSPDDILTAQFIGPIQPGQRSEMWLGLDGATLAKVGLITVHDLLRSHRKPFLSTVTACSVHSKMYRSVNAFRNLPSGSNSAAKSLKFANFGYRDCRTSGAILKFLPQCGLAS